MLGKLLKNVKKKLESKCEMLEKQKNDFKDQLDAIMIKHSINEKTINDQKN